MEITVRNGDSLWYYSRLLSIPFNLIKDSNPKVMSLDLVPGQKVQIPGITIQRYKIKKGDSFFTIAENKSIPVDALYLFNQAVNPMKISPNDEISIPVFMSFPTIEAKRKYDFSALNEDVEKLIKHYPFIKKQTIGFSVLGKPIDILSIGNGQKKVHVNGSFHGNEWITTAILMKFINEYAQALTTNKHLNERDPLTLYRDSTLLAVPMVDPDGVDLALNGPPENEEYRELVLKLNHGKRDFSDWKANIRGVDLNNQFPAKWEIEQKRKPQEPASRDFPGEKPLTEPEAIAMADAVERFEFDRVIALHTQGKEIYWGFEGDEPMPVSGDLAAEFEKVSGYKAIRYVDSYAGYKDWYIQEYKRPGFTVELGIGVNPLPLRQFDQIYKDTRGLLLAGLYM
ncbi:M14 family metallopeptidase [Fictibacillus barbaricus]|uniref:G-D-glutamyl-meso-diaminopimelate peptidase n=1 Tax=Fictibacillus barbaricus TaxID=182136 RepID=A0ABU1TZW5_9BACL|nr:M14 family zinc carboxypeptidase [Fictibacillus barbaricus]MDR7072726.1 g-D-glutamyl-meso-diaminopimelate peptidase [Fictibacillus barbaricus]